MSPVLRDDCEKNRDSLISREAFVILVIGLFGLGVRAELYPKPFIHALHLSTIARSSSWTICEDWRPF